MPLTATHSLPPAASVPAQRRLRVLVGCYALSPVRGSEPGMGWNICRAVAEHHDLTVLCTAGVPGWEPDIYRKEIDGWLRDNGRVPGLTIQYVPQTFWSNLVQREKELFRRTLYYSGYASWQRAAFRAAQSLHREQPFDLAHHLNMTGFREPGYLWQLDIPFVWGPVGGAANIPDAYLPLMSGMDRAFYRLRNWANERQKRSARRPLQAARAAKRIWAIGEENRRMAAEWGGHPVPLLESGTKPRAEARVRQRDLSRPLRLAWSGLHIGRKGLPILLHAIASIKKEVPVEVAVLGGGPESARWKAEAARLGVADRIRWTGQVSQSAALAEVAGADALAFTSVQEGTPHAVLEALSLGLPVICHDACGMGAAVTPQSGIRIPMLDPEQSISGFARAIRRLATDQDLLAALSAGALERASQLSWEGIGQAISDGYREVAAACGSNFTAPIGRRRA
jgi:glycosyltransferase involved in cell wall biosynthesis